MSNKVQKMDMATTIILTPWLRWLPLLVGTGLLIMPELYENAKLIWTDIVPAVIVILSILAFLFLRYQYPDAAGYDQPEEFVFMICFGLLFLYWLLVHLTYKELKTNKKLTAAAIVILNVWAMMMVYVFTGNMILWAVVCISGAVSIATVMYQTFAEDPNESGLISVLSLALAFGVSYVVFMMNNWKTMSNLFNIGKKKTKQDQVLSFGAIGNISPIASSPSRPMSYVRRARRSSAHKSKSVKKNKT